MKIKDNYTKSLALALGLIFAAVACSEDELGVETTKTNAGDEVQFGLDLAGLSTRTIYGDETTTGFPIYWVNGDEVWVASPQCDVKQAEYSVYVKQDSTQTYADSLKKTGSAGLQWGDTAADFYSIYPSRGSEFTIDDDNSVSTTLSISSYQRSHCTYSALDNIYYGQPNDMNEVVMYAVTKNVPNGEPVDLQYTPYSTVIEFTITAPTSVAQVSDTLLYVESLKLTAPDEMTIAGDFTFSFPSAADGTPTITAGDGGSNSITVYPTYGDTFAHLSTKNKTLKIKMCLMPISGVNSLDGWTIALTTGSGTFSLTLSDTSNATALTPGKVHKIILPELSYGSGTWSYSTKNWITSLADYEKIYLTELSLPGAWYAGSSEAYQATTVIDTLWNRGVRAFAVETRVLSRTATLYYAPNSVVVSGTGSEASLYTSYCGTNSLNTGTGTSAYVSLTGGTDISDIIESIASQISDEEFGVLVLSYADGGEGGHRPVDYGAWLELLKDSFDALDTEVKAKIYQYEITKNTVVGDVKGKLILKINVDEYIAMNGSVSRGSYTSSYSYNSDLPAMLSYNPYLSQIGLSYDQTPLFSKMFWKEWDDTSTYRSYSEDFDTDSFLWCFSSANRTATDGITTDIPTYSERQEALSTMITDDKIYAASSHNIWFYFQAGGTQATSSTSSNPSPTDYAAVMNLWLKGEIEDKIDAGDASSMGLVMFNQCTNDTYYGNDIIKLIIEMNSMFYLQRSGVDE